MLDGFWPMLNCVGCGSTQMCLTAIKQSIKLRDTDYVMGGSHFDLAPIIWDQKFEPNQTSFNIQRSTLSNTIQQVWPIYSNAYLNKICCVQQQ